MVDSPRFGITYSLPLPKWAHVCVSFCRLPDTAVLHIKLVAAHAFVVDSPRFGITYNLPLAKWAHVCVSFCRLPDTAVLHIKLVAAHASVVDSPRFGITYNLPLAKMGTCMCKLLLPSCDLAFRHVKSVAAHGSMVYLPCFGVTHDLRCRRGTRKRSLLPPCVRPAREIGSRICGDDRLDLYTHRALHGFAAVRTNVFA